jgi:glycogen debranching enzyme
MTQFERETCRDVEAALHREWLETNGLGGFASSTIVGLNTRRYHGLLVAATKPPVGRLVLLSKLEETLVIDGKRFDLSANRYPGVIHPQGFHYLKHFRFDPFPVFTYEVEGIEIKKSVFMIHGENSTVIHYELKKNHPGVTKERGARNPSIDCIPRLPRHDSRKRCHQPSGARTLRIGKCHSLSRIAKPALGA